MTAATLVAQRFIPSAGTVQALLTHRAVPTAAAVGALLWLSWALAQGTWRIAQPGSPMVSRGGMDAVDLSVLTRAQLFGPVAATQIDASLTPTNLNLTLTGVIARPVGGCALVIVQG
jgi:hypothetical protein